MCREGSEGRRWPGDEPSRDRWQRSPEPRREFRDSPDLRRGEGRPIGEEPGFEGRGFRRRSRSPPWRQDVVIDRSMLSYMVVVTSVGVSCSLMLVCFVCWFLALCLLHKHGDIYNSRAKS